MIHERLSKTLVLTTGLVVAVGALGATGLFAEQARSRSSASVSSQGSRGTTATRSTGGGGGSRGAASTRSGRGSRGGSHGGRGHHGGRGYYGGRSHHYGIGLGYYGYGWGWGWRYGGYFYSPFYYNYPVYYSYHPERFSDFGALDMNVRPKKTEVWIDGQYVGTAGRFDGYPGFLWLEDGPHELILFRQGKETVVREVNVLAGNVLDINVEMLAGEATPAEALTTFTPDELRKRRESADYRAQIERPARDERPARRADRPVDRRDVRAEPGRLNLSIEPADASIYLDGRFLGTGSELARLHSGLIVDPGEHVLEVVRPGFGSEEVPFSIEEGEEATLNITLTTG